MNLHNKYKDFEKRIKFNENIVKDDNQTLNELYNTIENSSKIINSLQNQTRYDSIDAFENLAMKCASEPPYYYGGQAKLNCGTKAQTGPFGYIYTRVAPGTTFSGTIRLYLSNFPENQTTAKIRFWINEVYTIEDYDIITDKDYQFEFNFDFFPTTTSNVFKVSFFDMNFKESILDFIEIITENGKNFLCLNRPDFFNFHSFVSKAGSKRYIYMSQLSNVGTFKAETQLHTNFTGGTTLQLPDSSLNIIKNHLRHQISLGGSYTNLFDQLSIAINGSLPENSWLYRTTVNMSMSIKMFNNVSSAFKGYHWRDSFHCFCGTLFNQQVFIGGASVTETDIPTINSVELPNQFITCTHVEDWGIAHRTAYKEIGYILLHNSGKIFFLPEDDATYFIEIGLGNQPNAYMQLDYKTIYVYYHFNNSTYKKELKLNTETNIWELTENVKVYPGVVEVFEAYEGRQIHIFYDGTRKTVTI